MDIINTIIDIVAALGGTVIDLLGQFLSDPFAAISGIVDLLLGILS